MVDYQLWAICASALSGLLAVALTLSFVFRRRHRELSQRFRDNMVSRDFDALRADIAAYGHTLPKKMAQDVEFFILDNKEGELADKDAKLAELKAAYEKHCDRLSASHSKELTDQRKRFEAEVEAMRKPQVWVTRVFNERDTGWSRYYEAAMAASKIPPAKTFETEVRTKWVQHNQRQETYQFSARYVKDSPAGLAFEAFCAELKKAYEQEQADS